MAAGVQCDYCRTFAPMPAPGWLHVFRQGDPGILAALSGGSGEVIWTFCCVLCMAQHAMAHALVEGKAAGEEPA
jgi:hypothetical protein